MSTTLKSTIKVTAATEFANVLDLSTVLDPVSIAITQQITNGTGAGKAQVVFHDEITLATGGSTSLDLSGGIAHAFGTCAFTKIKAILIRNKNTTAGHILQVGGGANCLASGTLFGNTSDIINVGPEGVFLITNPSAAGIAVTNSTADVLTISNASGATIVYDIVIMGEGS